MTDKFKGILIAGVVLVALVIGGAAIAGAAGGGDSARDEGARSDAGGRDDESTETPITGSALDKARAVAVDHTNGGRATATEAGDEEGAYEVEVTRANGSQVDVHLDRDFKVLSGIADEESKRD
jgi:hypothetical protein